MTIFSVKMVMVKISASFPPWECRQAESMQDWKPDKITGTHVYAYTQADLDTNARNRTNGRADTVKQRRSQIDADTHVYTETESATTKYVSEDCNRNIIGPRSHQRLLSLS